MLFTQIFSFSCNVFKFLLIEGCLKSGFCGKVLISNFPCCLCFQIDLEKSLEEQGPFDMILHKFTDILVKSQQGYITEQRIINHIEVSLTSELVLRGRKTRNGIVFCVILQYTGLKPIQRYPWLHLPRLRTNFTFTLSSANA